MRRIPLLVLLLTFTVFTGVGIAAPFEMWSWHELLDAPPDAGDGAWRELVVEDAASLRRLPRLAPRRLRFALSAEVGAGGLCLYQPDPGEAPGAVEVRLEGVSERMAP